MGVIRLADILYRVAVEMGDKVWIGKDEVLDGKTEEGKEYANGRRFYTDSGIDVRGEIVNYTFSGRTELGIHDGRVIGCNFDSLQLVMIMGKLIDCDMVEGSIVTYDGGIKGLSGAFRFSEMNDGVMIDSKVRVGSSKFKKVRIEGCTFDNLSESNFEYCIIEGCTFERMSNVVFEDCIIKDCKVEKSLAVVADHCKFENTNTENISIEGERDEEMIRMMGEIPESYYM
jgi:hypothetical protein